jgi:hypothetical protein
LLAIFGPRDPGVKCFPSGKLHLVANGTLAPG